MAEMNWRTQYPKAAAVLVRNGSVIAAPRCRREAIMLALRESRNAAVELHHRNLLQPERYEKGEKKK